MAERNILLNPGPANTTESVKAAMTAPDICPREREFGDVMKRVGEKLAQVVNAGDEYVAVPFCGSGTLGLEACISSVVPDGKKILVLNNGAYGERMAAMARIHNLETLEYITPWGESPDLEEVESLFRENRGEISHLAIVHHETTTGMLNPVQECVRIARRYGAEVIVDAMSSYAGIPIDARTMDFDYLISSSNKCIQGMAGIVFVVCRKSLMLKEVVGTPRTMYMDLRNQYNYFVAYHQSAFTPPVQVFYALDRALDEYFEETGAGRAERYAKSFKTLCQGMEKLGFRFLLKKEQQSGILLAVEEPSNPAYSFDELHDHMRSEGFTVYPGKGAKLPTFRLSVLGAITHEDISNFLNELETYLKTVGLFGQLYDD